MASVTHKGNTVVLSGELPKIGAQAPNFSLTGIDMSTKTLADFPKKYKIISLVPSLDTRVCAQSARAFNEKVSQLNNTVVLNISADLPFAAKRFCEAEGLSNIHALSTFKNPQFAKDYGALQTNGALEGLLARAVLVLNEENCVIYSELVPDIGQEPNYEKILQAIGVK